MVTKPQKRVFQVLSSFCHHFKNRQIGPEIWPKKVCSHIFLYFFGIQTFKVRNEKSRFFRFFLESILKIPKLDIFKMSKNRKSEILSQKKEKKWQNFMVTKINIIHINLARVMIAIMGRIFINSAYYRLLLRREFR